MQMKKGDVFQMTAEEILRSKERKAKAQARALAPRKAVNNDLARAMASGDQSARSKLIEQNCKLVYKIASKYHGADQAELISEGLTGLCHAADTFDPERGIAFSTHASWSIKQRILRFIVDNHSQVKLGTTDSERKVYWRLSREESKLAARGLSTDSASIAEVIGNNVTASDVDNMRHRLSVALCASLDAGNVSEDGNGLPLIDRLDNGDGTPESIIASKETDSLILKLRVEFEQTLSQVENAVWQACVASEDSRNGSVVAESTGLCKQRISQIKNDLVNRFVKYAKRNGLGK